MIKADTIKRLSNEVVSSELLETFETLGFKYLKSKTLCSKIDRKVQFGEAALLFVSKAKNNQRFLRVFFRMERRGLSSEESINR